MVYPKTVGGWCEYNPVAIFHVDINGGALFGVHGHATSIGDIEQ
jgi:hypothetical protein